MIHSRFVVVGFTFATLVGAGTSASALPTMIRLGYANCAACHLSPQGGGPLNEYGRSIDEAQSLRAKEYRPAQNPLAFMKFGGGLMVEDLRAVFVDQGVWVTHKSATNTFRPRLMYRNFTDFGNGFRVSGVVSAESEPGLRPALWYDPPATAPSLFVNTALVHYRPSEKVEFAAGKDQLPAGIYIPDSTAFIKARNRFGSYDTPMQVKAFVGGSRYQVMPFAYLPGGYEPTGDRESGVGTIAEFDVLGKGRTIVGASLLHGSADYGNRQMIGAYARLGFGKWGILAEHDVTDRRRNAPDLVANSFRQQTSFAQVFWAAREWLVASAIGEKLTVEQPFLDRQAAAKFEISARLSNQAAVTLSTRAVRNQMTQTWGKSLTVQVAVKTAQ